METDIETTAMGSLRTLIAEMLLTEKAASRDTWQNHLINYLTGAIGEFYKARLGEKNKLSVQQDIDHWNKEVKSLLRGAQKTYRQKTKGFKNKEKAYNAIIDDELKNPRVDAYNRREAARIICDDYNLPELKLQITDEDTAEFWKNADATVAGIW